jgi:hypothetical protein
MTYASGRSPEEILSAGT